MVQSEALFPLAAILAGIVTGIIVITDDGRVTIGLLFLQYLFSAVLVHAEGSLQLAIIKIVTAATVCLILIATWSQSRGREEIVGDELPTGRAFRMISVLLVTTAAIGLGRSELVAIPEISPEGLSAALLLGGMGLLQVSLREGPSNVAVGIISLLNGFEIVYIGLEDSLAVMALIALVHISLAVVIGIIELDVEETGVQAGDT